MTGGPERNAGDLASQGMFQLSRAGIAVTSFALGQPSLDKAFLPLTGHGTSDSAPEENVA